MNTFAAHADVFAAFAVLVLATGGLALISYAAHRRHVHEEADWQAFCRRFNAQKEALSHQKNHDEP